VLSSRWELDHQTVVDVFASIDTDGNGSISASELDRAISIFETHGHESPADKLKKHWCLCVCVPACVCVCVGAHARAFPVHARLRRSCAYCRYARSICNGTMIAPKEEAHLVNASDHMLCCLVAPPPQAFPCPAAASQASHARSSTRPQHAQCSPRQPTLCVWERTQYVTEVSRGVRPIHFLEPSNYVIKQILNICPWHIGSYCKKQPARTQCTHQEWSRTGTWWRRTKEGEEMPSGGGGGGSPRPARMWATPRGRTSASEAQDTQCVHAVCTCRC
jgi:hypothetical protein